MDKIQLSEKEKTFIQRQKRATKSIPFLILFLIGFGVVLYLLTIRGVNELSHVFEGLPGVDEAFKEYLNSIADIFRKPAVVFYLLCIAIMVGTYLSQIKWIRIVSKHIGIPEIKIPKSKISRWKFGLPVFLSAIFCTVLIWIITPSNLDMPKYIYFIEGGPYYIVFFKIGLFLFDIGAFVTLIFWDEVLNAKKRHGIIFVILWIVVFLSFLLDTRWK